MTVPLLRVCYHCGYPTPGRHASSCRDADSGVVEVAKPLVPADVAQQIRDVEAQRDGLAELLKGAVEAGERYRAEASGLRQELDEARAELAERDMIIDRVHAAEKAFLSRAVDAEHELARLRPVVESAEALVDDWKAQQATHGHGLIAAVDAYRSATPDAEPAPGVPVDTEATP